MADRYDTCEYTNQSRTITLSSKMSVFFMILCKIQNRQAFRFHLSKTVDGSALEIAKGSITHVLFAVAIFSSSVSPIPLFWSTAVKHASIFSLQFCSMRAYPVWKCFFTPSCSSFTSEIKDMLSVLILVALFRTLSNTSCEASAEF